MPCFLFYPTLVPARFFLLTSYKAIPALFEVLVARLFLLLLRLTQPILFRRVGFLRRWVLLIFLMARTFDPSLQLATHKLQNSRKQHQSIK